MKEYINRIIAIIIDKTGMDPEDISEESYFEDDLNVDPIELLEIISFIEEEYKVSLEKEEKERIKSIMDLVEIVFEKVE